MNFWERYNHKNSDGIIEVDSPVIKIEDSLKENYTLSETKDTETIVNFLNENYLIKYGASTFENIITNCGIILQLETNKKIIGIITAKFTKFNIGVSYIINHLCIAKQYRNKRLCTFLIESISDKIFNKGILYAVFSSETLLRNVKFFSMKKNFIFIIKRELLNGNIIKIRNFEKKIMNRILNKKYFKNIHTDFTEESKKKLFENYKKSCKGLNLYISFSNFDELMKYYSHCKVLYDDDFNFVVMSSNSILDNSIRRSFIEAFYISTNNREFIKKIIGYLDKYDIADIVQLNLQLRPGFLNGFIEAGNDLYYYFYNYNINSNVKDNIFIT